MFISLHNHIFSQFDSFGNLDERIEFLLKNNINAFAITDHCSFIGVYDFWNKMIKNNLKPIIGCEFYITDEKIDNLIKKKNEITNNINTSEEEKINRYHLILLAKNKEGYKLLLKLFKISYEFFYKKPLIPLEIFTHIDKNELKNIIILSACRINNIAIKLIEDKIEEAEKNLEFYLKIFPNFYLELQANKAEEYKKVIEGYKYFSNKYSIPIVLTSDSHYTYKEDYLLHKFFVLNSFKNKKTIYDLSALNYFSENNLYIYTLEDVYNEFTNLLEKDLIDKAINNINNIVKEIDIYDLGEKTLQIPKPFKKSEDLKKIIREMCYNRLKELNLDKNKIYINRLNYELDVITKNNYESYFLLLEEILKEIRKKYGKYSIGIARGSAGGCLVAYLLQIIQIDPIKFDLSFERFLNSYRCIKNIINFFED